ncbi:MAG: hypothetical protein JXB49_12705 [Bacteroidales bacterium]|nr:hypothetical protein [Bacteroidales bacterium]
MMRIYMIKNVIIVFCLLFLFSIDIFTQKDTIGIKYTPDFQFKEGIYLSFAQVKSDSPIPKSKILTTTDYNDKDFFTKVLSENVISFYNDLGEKVDVELKKIWGYSRNGALYINLNGDFQRITIIGRICHFVANVTTYDNVYYDPYYYRYYNSYYYTPRSNSVASNELRQFILDFDSGKLLDYTVSNLEVLLMKDPELFDEYNNLRNKKKKQLKFVYIRKFNERNPLYIIPNN